MILSPEHRVECLNAALDWARMNDAYVTATQVVDAAKVFEGFLTSPNVKVSPRPAKEGE